MKNYSRALLAPILVVGLAACTENPDSPSNGSSDPDSTGQAAYPLEVCVVSGEKLGSMGDPVVVEVEGHTFKLCCASCEEKLRDNPDKYIKMLESGKVEGSHSGPDGHGDGDHSGHDH